MGVLLPIERTAAVIHAEDRPYEELICSPTFAWDCQKAYRVMLCESSGDARAYAAGNYGLMQISYVHAARVGGDVTRLYNPEVNLQVAYEIWMEQGWNPWGCRFAIQRSGGS